MSEVHKAITAHSQKQHALVSTFLQLENMREFLIDEAVELCKSHQAFDVDKLNEVTKQINDLAKNNVFMPTRKTVTKEMVMEYANRLLAKETK